MRIIAKSTMWAVGAGYPMGVARILKGRRAA
jgi:hypothetical protein